MDNAICPVVLKKSVEESVYYVTIPDLGDNVTYGDTIESAIEASRDVISLFLYDLKEENKEYPNFSSIENITVENDEFVVLIDLWLPYHFSKIKDVYKKKTLTIPTWLDALATSKNINFSAVLQKALKDELNIQ